MGRKKINIQPIQSDRNRKTTYIKRKAGLFKKAHELAVLTDSDVAVLVFGPNGKLAEFCSGDIEELLVRYAEYHGNIERRGSEHFARMDHESSQHEPISSPRNRTNRRNTSMLATMRGRIDSWHNNHSQKAHQTTAKVVRTASQPASSCVTQDDLFSEKRASPLTTVHASMNESKDWAAASQQNALPNTSSHPSDSAPADRPMPDHVPLSRRWPQSIDLGLLLSPADYFMTNAAGKDHLAADAQVSVPQHICAQQTAQTFAPRLHITPTTNDSPGKTPAVSLSVPASPLSPMHLVQSAGESLLLNRSCSCPNTALPFVSSLDHAAIPIPHTFAMKSQPQPRPCPNSLSSSSSYRDGAPRSPRSADASDLSSPQCKIPKLNTQELPQPTSTVSPLTTNADKPGLLPQASLHVQHSMTPASILLSPPSYLPVPHTM